MAQPVNFNRSWNSVKSKIMPAIIIPQWILLVFFVVVFIQPIELPRWIQFLPLIASTLMFGLPHGAVDHFIPGWVQKKPLILTHMITLLVVYLMLVALVVGLWIVSPVWTFIGFIFMTWWHWGTGDLEAVLSYGSVNFLITRVSRLTTAIIRGGLPMLVPLIFFPDDYQLGANTMVSIFGLDASVLDTLFSLETRFIIALAFGSLICVALSQSWIYARQLNLQPQWYRYAFETVLLILFFSTVPPILAIGLYFCLWHAPRHIIRIIQIRRKDEEIYIKHDLNQFMRSALPTTIIALVMFAGLFLLYGSTNWDLLSFASLYLVLIAALTLPHTLIITWLDWKQGLWRVR